MSLRNSGEEHARYLYEIRGDVSSSFHSFKQILNDLVKVGANNNKNKNNSSFLPVLVHNNLLLECLQQQQNNNDKNKDNHNNNDYQKIIAELEAMMIHHNHQPPSNNNNNNNNNNDDDDENGKIMMMLSELQYLILSYNLALITIVTSSDYEKAEQMLFPIYSQFEHQIIRVKKEDEQQQQQQQQMIGNVRDVQCKIAFLLMDTILEQTKGTASVSTLFLKKLNGILEWIQNYLSETLALNQTRSSTTPRSTTTTQNKNHDSTTCFFNESITEIKYRLHLYKTRIKFLREEYQMEEQDDAKTRVARKELKNAMEIYHRKLANPSTSTTTAKNTNNTTTGVKNSSSSGGGEGSTIHSRGGSLDESAAASTYEGSINSTTSNLDTMPTTTKTTTTTSSSGSTSSYNNQQDSTTTSQGKTKTAFKSKRLHDQNQYALYLKANLEHFKGNTKKSLKLCAEALHASQRRRESVEEMFTNNNNNKDDGHFNDNNNNNNNNNNSDKQNSSIRQSLVERCQDKDYAIYYNNLGILHQSSGKIHIAMHYFTKGLSCIERLEKQHKTISPTSFEFDGTIGIIPKHEILYNTAICANTVPGNKNAKFAYECMAKCVHGSHSFRKRPRCWLRMAESCVGIHSNLKANAVPDGVTSFPNLSVTKESTFSRKTFIISDKKRNMIQQKYCPVKLKDENLSQTLGNHTDVVQVSNNPLPRAIYCIQKCLLLCNSSDADNGEREKEIEVGEIDDYIDSAMVLLSYIWLELKEYAPALSAAQLVLSRLAAKSVPNGESDRSKQINEKRRRRKQACARMYACEAYCAMGNPDSATNILMNNNGDDEDLSKGKQRLNELGNDLVLHYMNSNMIAKNMKPPLSAWKKRREKESLASVYTMAAGVSILKGNLHLAKEYAETAVSFTESEKDSPNQNAIRSNSTPTFASENSLLAKKALLHCLLQNDEHEKALELLQAAHFT